jgi:uncharacterized membrane protein
MALLVLHTVAQAFWFGNCLAYGLSILICEIFLVYGLKTLSYGPSLVLNTLGLLP